MSPPPHEPTVDAPNPPVPAAGRIAELLERLGLLFRSRQHSPDLNPAQWAALRYLGRANRYSRHPSALTDYLGATKGTVSQTLIALERKRLLTRRAASDDRRGVRLALTAAGRVRLASDPLRELAAAAVALDDDAQAALAGGLTRMLSDLQRRNGGRGFGICRTCRHFRRDDAPTEAGGPHRCGLTGEPLAEAEAEQICAEHQTRAA